MKVNLPCEYAYQGFQDHGYQNQGTLEVEPNYRRYQPFLKRYLVYEFEGYIVKFVPLILPISTIDWVRHHGRSSFSTFGQLFEGEPQPQP